MPLFFPLTDREGSVASASHSVFYQCIFASTIRNMHIRTENRKVLQEWGLAEKLSIVMTNF